MPKLLAPTQKESKIRNVPGVTADDPIVVVFRQANEGDVLKRQEMLTRSVRRSWGDQGDYNEELDLIIAARQRAVEVWLTLAGCNIENGNGQLLFKFEGGRLKYDTFDKFHKIWNELPPEWALEIHNRCLIVNPTWGVALIEDDDDDTVEAAITDPEDEAGDAQ